MANGNVMKIMLNPVNQTTIVTAPHMQDWIEMLSQAKTHGNIFATTDGIDLTANDIFKGIILKQRKITCKKLMREKTLCKRQEKIQFIALDILQRKGENPMMLTLADLTSLLTWHQYPKWPG